MSPRAKATAKTKDPQRKPDYPSLQNKITVVLAPENVAFLDRLSIDIRMKTGANFDRSKILRALVTALKASKLDVTGAKDEDDLTGQLKEAIGKP